MNDFKIIDPVEHDQNTIAFLQKFENAIQLLVDGFNVETDQKFPPEQVYATCALTLWNDLARQIGAEDLRDFSPERFRYAAKMHFLGEEIIYTHIN